jgi:hypothetical protein
MRSYWDCATFSSRFVAPRGPFLFSLLTLALTAGAFTCVMHASYPGYLNPDTIFQLTQIYDGWLNDWHPPFVTLVWSGLLKVYPSAASLVAFHNLLIWASVAVLALSAYRRVGSIALAVILIPLLPGTANFLGNAVKDTTLAAWLLLSFASAYQVHRSDLSPVWQRVWPIATNIFTVCSFLTRPNIILGLIPLILYTNYRLGWKRNILACVGLLVLMPGIQAVQNRMVGARAVHAADSVKLYHMVALSYFHKRNELPGSWSSNESRAIYQDCYSAIQVDSALWGECRFIKNGLEKQGLWGSASLTKGWLTELVKDPRGAFSAMAATFWRCLHTPNSQVMLYNTTTDRFPWAVTPPFRATTTLAIEYLTSKLNYWISRPAVFIILFFASTFILLVFRLAYTRDGLFALAVTMSGMLYMLTYLPINVSAEYRYFYWSGFAAYMGVIFSFFAYVERKRCKAEPAVPLPAPVRLCACVLIAASAAFALFPMTLPTERRVIMVVPKGDGVVGVSSVKTASIPPWMGVRFEAQPKGAGWHWRDSAWRATAGPDTGALLTVLDTLHQSIRLEFERSPNGAVVQVQDGWFVRTVDTSGGGGSLTIDLPPLEIVRIDRRIHRDKIAVLGLLFVGLSALLFLATGRWRSTVVALFTRGGRGTGALGANPPTAVDPPATRAPWRTGSPPPPP